MPNNNLHPNSCPPSGHVFSMTAQGVVRVDAALTDRRALAQALMGCGGNLDALADWLRYARAAGVRCVYSLAWQGTLKETVLVAEVFKDSGVAWRLR